MFHLWMSLSFFFFFFIGLFFQGGNVSPLHVSVMSGSPTHLHSSQLENLTSLCLDRCLDVFVSMYQCLDVFVSMSQCFDVFVSMSQCLDVLGSISQCLDVIVSMFGCLCLNVSMFECLSQCHNVWMSECINVQMSARQDFSQPSSVKYKVYLDIFYKKKMFRSV